MIRSSMQCCRAWPFGVITAAGCGNLVSNSEHSGEAPDSSHCIHNLNA